MRGGGMMGNENKGILKDLVMELDTAIGLLGLVDKNCSSRLI